MIGKAGLCLRYEGINSKRLTIHSNDSTRDVLRMYITLPVGTGKSIILAAFTQSLLSSGRVLVLIHRQDIAKQLAETFEQAGLPVGLLMQGYRNIEARIVVATTQSLTAMALQELLHAHEQSIVAICIDEAHHAVKGSAYERIIATVEEASPQHRVPVIGCTATPYRSDTQSMLSLLPTCAFARDIPDMVRLGSLAPLVWKPLHVDIDLSKVITDMQSGENEYVEDALASELVRAAITREIARLVVPHIQGRPTLVFAVSIEHAQQLAEAFAQCGLSARAISGRNHRAEREQIVSDWRRGIVQVVCNCSLLTEGFDFPSISALVIARPTLSPSLYMQMLGRGTRPAPGKQDCLVLDVMGNNPDTGRQVVLPQVVGDTQAAGGNVPASGRGERLDPGKQADPFLKQLFGNEGGSSFSLLDPIGQSWYRWTPYRQGPHEGYFTRVSRYESALIERDPSGSGLYRSRLHIKRPYSQPEDAWVCQDYLPLRQHVALVHAATNKKQSQALRSKDAPWLERPATEEQLQVLQRIHPKAAQRAREERWTQQEASDAITFSFLRNTLTHPPKGDNGQNDVAS